MDARDSILSSLDAPDAGVAPLTLGLQLRIGLIAVLSGICFGLIRLVLHISTNDLWLAYGSAQLLARGANPYDYPTNGWPSNPLTTILAIIPFAWLPLEWVGAGLIAISTALLIFGALRVREPWRLYALLSWPFWYNLIYAQWGILFLAMLLLPGLIWLTPVKPQLGMSVFLSRFQWRQAIYAALFLALSWVIYPGWPALWLAQLGGYDGFVPVFTLPVAIMALVLIALSIRSKTISQRLVFFLLFCCTPQRLWHDQLLLWSIPGHPRSMLLLSILSWVSLLAFVVLYPIMPLPQEWAVIVAVFLPSGLMLLRECGAAQYLARLAPGRSL